MTITIAGMTVTTAITRHARPAPRRAAAVLDVDAARIPNSQHILEAQQQRASYEEMRKLVLGELRRHFRPEFLNRVDETVVFHPLTGRHLEQIVEIQLAKLRDRLAERRIRLVLTPAATANLAERGYDPVYGARPLKRLIQQDIETPIARLLVKGEVRDGDTARLDLKKGQIVVVPTVEARKD